MDLKGKLFVFTAPSGAGKTTIVRNVLNNFDELDFSISATTRKARNNEVDGKDYFFISEEEFLKKIEEKEFIEWEKFYGYYYGTLRKFIEDKIKSGKSVVLDIDVKGAESIKKNYPESIIIFVSPPSMDELKARLVNRKTESKEDLQKRIERAEMELNYRDEFDFVILNDELHNAIEKAKEIVKENINQEE